MPLGLHQTQVPACGLNISSKLCLMANHLMISLNGDLMLVVTAWVGPHHNIQLCSTSGNGKSPALTSFPLFTEQTETFFLFSEQRRGRTQYESVAVLPFHEWQDADLSPSKYSCGLILQGTEQSLLFSTHPPPSPVRV